jgi:hypothetical protein
MPSVCAARPLPRGCRAPCLGTASTGRPVARERQGKPAKWTFFVIGSLKEQVYAHPVAADLQRLCLRKVGHFQRILASIQHTDEVSDMPIVPQPSINCTHASPTFVAENRLHNTYIHQVGTQHLHCADSSDPALDPSTPRLSDHTCNHPTATGACQTLVPAYFARSSSECRIWLGLSICGCQDQG